MEPLRKNLIGVAAFLVVGGLIAFAATRLQPSATNSTTANTTTRPTTNTPANISIAHEVTGPAPTSAPSLYVVKREGITYTTFNATTHEYNAPTPFVAVTDVLKLNTTKDAVYIYRSDAVERRDHTGRLIATWNRTSSPTYTAPTTNSDQAADQLKAGIYDNGRLYLAVNRSFVILDDQLRELGHLSPLQANEISLGKAIDDIMIIDHDAFIVDDIASPLFVFSVDITNPRQPTLIHTFGVGGVYGTITNQWFEDRSGKWCLQRRTSSGYVGDEYTIICMTPELYHARGTTNADGYLDETPPGLTVRTIGENSNGGQDGPETGNGFAILRELNHLDDFMLVEHRLSDQDDIVGLGDDYTIQAKLNIAKYLEIWPLFFYRYGPYVYFYAEDQLVMFHDDGTNLTSQLQQRIPKVTLPNKTGTGTHQDAAWLSFAADPR